MVCTGHKIGCVLSNRIWKIVCAHIRHLSLQKTKRSTHMKPGVVYHVTYSNQDWRQLKDTMRCTRQLRHPLEVVASGYRFRRDDKYNCTSHSRYGRKIPTDLFHRLTHLPLKEGVLLEMKEIAQYTIMDMYNWMKAHGNDSRALPLHLEDFRTDFNGTVTGILNHMQISESNIKALLPKMACLDLTKRTSEDISSDEHITNKSEKVWTWPDLFDQDTVRELMAMLPSDIMSTLGYPDPLSA